MLHELLQILKGQVLNIVGYQIELPEILRKIVDGYKEYYKKTLFGKHGKTAQYYLQYNEFINWFLRFSRSIRCSDFELYTGWPVWSGLRFYHGGMQYEVQSVQDKISNIWVTFKLSLVLINPYFPRQ